MNPNEYKKISSHLKEIIENIDPASLGGKGEYDRLIDSIIRTFFGEKKVLSKQSLNEIMSGQFKHCSLTEPELQKLLDSIEGLLHESLSEARPRPGVLESHNNTLPD